MPASRLLCALLLLLGILAALAVLASELPRAAAWLVAFAALLHAWQTVHSERHRAPIALVIAPGEHASTVDGRPVTGLTVIWRGPLAFLTWRDPDGHRQRLALWPDVLDPVRRRELRLAAPSARDAPQRASVAP